jgi:glycosyltransferase involved in cell wall biosynthesis
MRIGIFSECYKPTKNGVVTSIDTFREIFELEGHQVFIFAPKTWDYKDAADGHIFRFPSIIVPGQANYPIGIPICPRIDAVVSLLKLDIIHVQSLFPVSRYGRRQARKLKIPLVMTYHTLIEEYAHYIPFFKKPTQNFLIKLSRNFANSCDQIVTPSSPMKEKLLEYGVSKPIEIIPTGIRIEDFKTTDPEKLKRKYNIDLDKKILLYAGRIAEEKNLPFLIQAYKKIIDQYPKVHLLIVGDGPDKGKIEKEVKSLELEKNVTFAGFLDREEITKVYGAIDIFTFPSKTETQGIVVAEAMAGGNPAIAVNEMGPTEIIEDGKNGYLVPDNETVFAEKVLELLKNPTKMDEMAESARARAEEFDYHKTGQKMLELYQKLKQSYT